MFADSIQIIWIAKQLLDFVGLEFLCFRLLEELSHEQSFNARTDYQSDQ